MSMMETYLLRNENMDAEDIVKQRCVESESFDGSFVKVTRSLNISDERKIKLFHTNLLEIHLLSDENKDME